MTGTTAGPAGPRALCRTGPRSPPRSSRTRPRAGFRRRFSRRLLIVELDGGDVEVELLPPDGGVGASRAHPHDDDGGLRRDGHYPDRLAHRVELRDVAVHLVDRTAERVDGRGSFQFALEGVEGPADLLLEFEQVAAGQVLEVEREFAGASETGGVLFGQSDLHEGWSGSSLNGSRDTLDGFVRAAREEGLMAFDGAFEERL